MLVISVPSFEEQPDSSGTLVTYYIVNVEDSSTSMKYSIIKRYSSFQTLRDGLKDRYPELESFRFPHKSMFNTHSKFTKDRRRQGFDDFLKMLTTVRPMPPEFEDFLELREHISRFDKVLKNKNSNNITSSSPDGHMTTPSTTSISSSTPAMTSQTSSSSSTSKVDPIPNKALSSISSSSSTSSSRVKLPIAANSREPQLIHEFRTTSGYLDLKTSDKVHLSEQEIMMEIRKFTPAVLRSTYMWICIAYLFMVYMRIIDVSSTTVARMVLTVLSSGCVVCFLRIALLRRQLLLKDDMHVKESASTAGSHVNPTKS